MSKEILIPYAFNKSKDNKLESAFEADKKYIYVCPCCGEQLILKQGKIKIHHFSHPKNSECNANAAGQTSMHYKSKEFFQDAVLKGQNHIRFPIYKGEYFKNQYIDFCYTNVKIERRLGDIIPDIILENDKGEQVLVEITVTHGIDDNKLSKLEKLQLPCIEYDLSKLYESVGTKFDEKLLYDVIINFDAKNNNISSKELLEYQSNCEQKIYFSPFSYYQQLKDLFVETEIIDLSKNSFDEYLWNNIIEDVLFEANELYYDEDISEFKSIDDYFDRLPFIDWYNRLNDNYSHTFEITDDSLEIVVKTILKDETTCNFLNQRQETIKKMCISNASTYMINNKLYHIYIKYNYWQYSECYKDLTENQKKYLEDLRKSYIKSVIRKLNGLDKETIQLNIDLLQYLLYYAKPKFWFDEKNELILKNENDSEKSYCVKNNRLFNERNIFIAEKIDDARIKIQKWIKLDYLDKYN